jgi:hypothetical protein
LAAATREFGLGIGRLGLVEQRELRDAGEVQEDGFDVGVADRDELGVVVDGRKRHRVVGDGRAVLGVLDVVALRRCLGEREGCRRIVGGLHDAAAREHRRVHRLDGLVARVRPAADIDGRADEHAQYDNEERKHDGDAALGVLGKPAEASSKLQPPTCLTRKHDQLPEIGACTILRQHLRRS